MKKFLALSLSVVLMAGCGSSSLKQETHATLTGDARNEAAAKLVKVQGSDQDMDKFFSGPRELKNACIVGFHNHTIVNDNTANYKTETDIPMGNGWAQRHTFSLSYDFKPSPAYFQGITDYAYDTLASTLKAYGYNVIDAEAMKKAPSYIAKGEKSSANYDQKAQYSGYFDNDPKGLRNYDNKTFANARLLTANDEWASQLHKETNCEIIVTGSMLGSWKVKGAGGDDNLKALMLTTDTQMGLGFYVPWSVWDKASKEIKKKIYGKVNRGGNAHMKSALDMELLYAMGDVSKAKPEHLNNLALNTENTIKNTIAAAIEYQVRAFHTEVYTQKKVPTDLKGIAAAYGQTIE